jgi:hypothetical protein
MTHSWVRGALTKTIAAAALVLAGAWCAGATAVVLAAATVIVGATLILIVDAL